MFLKMLVFLPFNHLTRLLALEEFIIFSYRESFKSYIVTLQINHQLLLFSYA